jgi:class 3 adenylate cyclase
MIEIDQLNITHKSIMFIDIINSTLLWDVNDIEMINALKKLSTIITKYSVLHNNEIVQFNGDSFMLVSDKLINSIYCGIDIQKYLKNNNIKINNKILNVRIGICYGEVYKTEVNIQNEKRITYLGKTSNIASKIESNICNQYEVCFTSSNIIDNINKQYNLTTVKYKNIVVYKIKL